MDGVEYAVTGTTAWDKDWEASMTRTAPLVFGFVLVFAFLAPARLFRSIVVALNAIVLNLLSVGAAYGVLVMLFQWGWGESSTSSPTAASRRGCRCSRSSSSSGSRWTTTCSS